MGLYNDASLIFLPSGGAGKDTKAYSVKPTDGTGDFTFSRGSNLSATRVGPTGLIEKGRENHILHSQDLTNAVYIDGGSSGYSVVRTANYGTAPDGTQTADRIQISRPSGNTYAEIYQRLTTLTGSVCVFSFYGKSLSGNATLYGGYSNAYVGEFDFTTEWQRFQVFIPNAGNQTGFNLLTWESLPSTSQSADVLIWGVQLEQGLAATDYIESGATKGKAGLLENEPRFDYSGGATCPSLLLEGSRTNVIAQSEYFGAWSKIGSPTITSNYGTSPEGLQNSTRIEAVDGDRIYIGISGSSATYTYSIYAKGSGDIKLRDNSGSYNLSISLTSNWQRYDYSFTASFTNIQIEIDSTTDAEIWGAQLEQGSYPTSYIPNHSGGSVTRGVDVCNSAGDSSTFNDSEGVLYVEIAALANDGANRRIVISDGTFQNNVQLYYYSFPNRVRTLVNSGGITSIDATAAISDATIYHKIAIRYKTNDFSLWVDGVQVATDTSGNTPSGLNQLNFNDAGGSNFYGKAKQVLYFPTALSDADCITLTT